MYVAFFFCPYFSYFSSSSFPLFLHSHGLVALICPVLSVSLSSSLVCQFISVSVLFVESVFSQSCHFQFISLANICSVLFLQFISYFQSYLLGRSFQSYLSCWLFSFLSRSSVFQSLRLSYSLCPHSSNYFSLIIFSFSVFQSFEVILFPLFSFM
jgi:hypothetical protein